MIVDGDELGNARDHGGQNEQDAEQCKMAWLRPLRRRDPPQEERGQQHRDGAEERHRPRRWDVFHNRRVEAELVDGSDLHRRQDVALVGDGLAKDVDRCDRADVGSCLFPRRVGGGLVGYLVGPQRPTDQLGDGTPGQRPLVLGQAGNEHRRLGLRGQIAALNIGEVALTDAGLQFLTGKFEGGPLDLRKDRLLRSLALGNPIDVAVEQQHEVVDLHPSYLRPNRGEKIGLHNQVDAGNGGGRRGWRNRRRGRGRRGGRLLLRRPDGVRRGRDFRRARGRRRRWRLLESPVADVFVEVGNLRLGRNRRRVVFGEDSVHVETGRVTGRLGCGFVSDGAGRAIGHEGLGGRLTDGQRQRGRFDRRFPPNGEDQGHRQNGEDQRPHIGERGAALVQGHDRSRFSS